MTSWRDTTPQPIQDDLDALMQLGFDRAQDLLTEHGEFFPFGVTMNDHGQDGFADGDPTLGEQPASQLVLDVLYEGAAAIREGYRAFAFVADVKFNGADAVRVEAEHRDDVTALVIMLPYRRKGLIKKTVVYGEVTAGLDERRVWTD